MTQRILLPLLLISVGCAGPKADIEPESEGLTTGEYIVGGDGDTEGGLGESDAGDGGSGDGGSGDGSSGDGGSGDGGSGDGSSGDGSSGDGGAGDGSSGDGGSDGSGDGGSDGSGTGGATDADGDGFDNTEDCDDSNPDIYPGATEYCNTTDDDCDGSINGGAVDKTTSYEDADGDGYGNPDSTWWSCSVPSDYVLNADDCDDTDASRNPALGCDWNGAYSGTFTVTATISGVSDTCTDTLTVDVDDSVTPAVFGTGTCVWAGLGASFIGDVDYEIDGEFVSDDEVEGDVTIVDFGSEPWPGTFSSPGNLYGTASGSGSYGGYSYTYTAEIDLNR